MDESSRRVLELAQERGALAKKLAVAEAVIAEVRAAASDAMYGGHGGELNAYWVNEVLSRSRDGNEG